MVFPFVGDYSPSQYRQQQSYSDTPEERYASVKA